MKKLPRPDRSLERRAARSDVYQYQYHEMLCGPEYLAWIAGADETEPYSAEILMLQDKLMDRIQVLFAAHLTVRQNQIINLFLANYMMTEVASILGITVSAVSQTIHKIAAKIRKVAARDKKCQTILSQIQHIIDNSLI